MIEYRHLVHVLSLGENGSFRRAADALGITQSALSRSIQALEKQLGVRLFDRLGRRVVPTAAGVVVAEHARRTRQSAEDLERELGRLHGMETGEISVGVGPAVGNQIAGAAIARLITEQPKVRVRVRVDNWQELVQDLRAGVIEFFLADASDIRDDESLVVQDSFLQRGVLFCRAGHPLLATRTFSHDALARYPLVMPRTPRSALRDVAEAVGRAGGPEGVLPLVECDHYPILREIVSKTNAVGAGILHAILPDVRSGLFVVLPVGPAARQPCGIVHLRGQTLSPGARLLVVMLMDVARAVVPAAEHSDPSASQEVQRDAAD